MTTCTGSPANCSSSEARRRPLTAAWPTRCAAGCPTTPAPPRAVPGGHLRHARLGPLAVRRGAVRARQSRPVPGTRLPAAPLLRHHQRGRGLLLAVAAAGGEAIGTVGRVRDLRPWLPA